MKPLIHIGYPKTATTWFQDSFYPNIINANYVRREEVKSKIIQPNTFDFSPERVRDYFHSPHRLIICEEMLLGSLYTGWSNGAFAKEIAQRIKACYPEGQVVIFIRNQIDAIASAYGQYIKSGGNYGIDTFLYHKNNYFFSHDIFLFSFAYLEYDKIIQYYRELFGKGQVHVFLYEEFCENNEAFLKRFCEQLELEVNFKGLGYRKINLSLRKRLIPVVKVLNIFTKRSVYFKYYLFNIPYGYKLIQIVSGVLNKFKFFGGTPRPEELLGKKNFDYIEGYYKQSNLRLCDLGVKEIEKYNYPL